ncbi:MAG: hypothetical protein RLZZ337_1290 [Bacteroidota bacterium]|jgi:inner membrane protein
MDSITQIVLGAAVGEIVLGKKVGNKAMLWGAIAGTIPDLDVFTKFFVDDLTANELHRGISHSLIFSILFAPILGYFISWIYRKTRQATMNDWGWLAFWALVTHPLLDCHTTWGTQFLWPLPYRVAYNNIFVVDPLYTLPFLILLAIAAFYKKDSIIRRKLNWTGIAISSLYMLWTLGVKWYVHSNFADNLQSQHIDYNRITTVPTPFNSILWTATVDADSLYFIGSYSLLDTDKNITFKRVDNNHKFLNDIRNEDVVKRLRFLSKDWYVVQKADIGFTYYDARFGPFFSQDLEPKYVFGYHLFKEGSNWKVKQADRPKVEMKEAFGTLWTRMKGQ